MTTATSATSTAEGIAKITICRPEVRNAFRPQTLFELSRRLRRGRDDDPEVGVIILTGAGRPGVLLGRRPAHPGRRRLHRRRRVAQQGIGRLNVLDLQIQIRRTPKPVVAMVAGYAIGGGHVLHVVCDLTIAADNARFGQTGPQGRLASTVATARGCWPASSARRRPARSGSSATQYDAQEALDMGLVNTVVPLEELEEETVAWCRRCCSIRRSRCA